MNPSVIQKQSTVNRILLVNYFESHVTWMLRGKISSIVYYSFELFLCPQSFYFVIVVPNILYSLNQFVNYLIWISIIKSTIHNCYALTYKLLTFIVANLLCFSLFFQLQWILYAQCSFTLCIVVENCCYTGNFF